MYRRIILGIALFFALIGVVAMILRCNKINDAKQSYKQIMKDIKGKHIISKIEEKEVMCVVEEAEDSKSVNHRINIMRKDKNTNYTYKCGTVVNDICMNEEYIYYADTAHDGGNFSYITRIATDYMGGELGTKRIPIDNIVISHISIHGKKLYIWGFDYNEWGVYSNMYVYDNVSMKREQKIDFSDYIIDVACDDIYDGSMYVTGRSGRVKDKVEVVRSKQGYYIEEDNNFICKVNLEDYSISKIRLGDISSYIRCGRDGIYVSNYDMVLDKGGFIYKLDYENYNIKLEKIMKSNNCEKIKSEVEILANHKGNKQMG